SRQRRRQVFSSLTRCLLMECGNNSIRCRLEGRSNANRLGKMGAMFPPSAKLLIPQEEWPSTDSDGCARRDRLSLQYEKWRVSGVGEMQGVPQTAKPGASCDARLSRMI